MNDQTAHISAEPTISTAQRATRQLMIKRIAGGLAPRPRPDLRSALRDLLAEADAKPESSRPAQQPDHD